MNPVAEPIATETEHVEVQFLSKEVNPRTQAARCVDGRGALQTELGPQMLGGSLHPIILWCIANNHELSPTSIRKQLSELTNSGFKTGFHVDDHSQSPACGCGFCDRLPDILKTAVSSRSEIKHRLTSLNPEMSSELEIAYERLRTFNIDGQIKISQQAIINEAQFIAANVETLTGHHEEQLAFLNTQPSTTFDTSTSANNHTQAFNLDLWAAQEQAQALGVNLQLATALSLILYQATEMVLVEQKGKPSLRVQIV
jgi:hypothetical protein